MTTRPNDEERLPLPEQEQSLERKRELTQEDLRRRYEEQQRRLACPGCGEEPFID